jgi:thiol:disulfide interchange protein DsbD
MMMWNRIKRLFHSKKRSHSFSSTVQKEITFFGAFALGASSGMIAAPCTTPVLTSILAYIANTQSVGLGFLLMLFFSLGLGTLLLVIAAFAGAIQLLPKSGMWMKTVKTASGLILLAFAEYLIYRAGNFGGL